MKNKTQMNERWFPARADPPEVSAIEARFRNTLAAEYAAGWGFYDRETRDRLGDEAVRLNIDVFLCAMKKAGLKLVDI